MLTLIPSVHVLTGLPRPFSPVGSIPQSSIHMTSPHHLNCCSSVPCVMSFSRSYFCCYWFISESIHSRYPCQTSYVIHFCS
jgi:hypothetical protein